MNSQKNDIEADVLAVQQIPAVATLLEVICRTTGMGFAAVARVTEDKWVACAVLDEIAFGLKPGSELKLETTICDEIRQHHQAVVIDHVSEDKVYAGHHTPLQYGFQSYISVPIFLGDGKFFGTLCAIDPRPALLNNPRVMGMFKLFTELISFHLNAIRELDLSETKLKEERRIAELREQFIAVLGHDLRNPLSAVSNSAQLLLRLSADEDVRNLANLIKGSTYRMSGLIENTLDFASGRLGGGISLCRSDCSPEGILGQVVSELRAIYPDRRIETVFDLSGTVYCDGSRIAQLFSNLLANALTYSRIGSPVRVEALADNGEFTLAVINYCEPISPEVLQRIFEPFVRGEGRAGQRGLGLGLYIAFEIARAHGGRLGVESNRDDTRFTLRLRGQEGDLAVG